MLTRSHLVLSIPLAVCAIVLSIMDFDFNSKPVQNTVIEKIEVPTQLVQDNKTYWDKLANEDLSRFYKIKDRLLLSKEDTRCLALNIFHEAATEPFAGKVAVAQITYNRVKDGTWGNSWCDVVYAPYQFSWTLSKRKRDLNPKGDLWNESVKAAYEFTKRGLRIHGLEASLHYHATWMEKFPGWSTKKVAILEIGQHVFYKKIPS